jgi:hypothetical protein
MAYEEALTCISRSAAADLSAHQFKFVQQTTTGVNLANATSDVLGVLQDKPAALGRACSVAIAGVSKLWCNSTGGIAAGDVIASSSVGLGVLAAASTASATFGIGEAMEALSSGVTAIISVAIDKR